MPPVCNRFTILFTIMMVPRKTLLIVFISIVCFTAIYLYFVKQQRQETVARYLPQPLPGDVYKMESKTASTGRIAFYLQVKEAAGESVFFYRSIMTNWAPNDIFLNHFDSTELLRYSKKDLQEIKAGRWDNDEHDNTTLLEITRK